MSALWYLFIFVKYQNIHIFKSHKSQHIELLQWWLWSWKSYPERSVSRPACCL